MNPDECTNEEAFLKYVISEIVSKPQDIKIVRTVDELGVLIGVQVDKDDMGAVIGKEGNTAKAIRTLLRVVGMKNQSRVNMKIYEPGDTMNS